MSPDHSVKVHSDVLVVQLTPHDVVSVLQQINRVIGELFTAEYYANNIRGENPCFRSGSRLDLESTDGVGFHIRIQASRNWPPKKEKMKFHV